MDDKKVNILLCCLIILLLIIILDNIIDVDWSKEIDYIEKKDYNDEIYICPYCQTDMQGTNIIDLNRNPYKFITKCPKCGFKSYKNS